MPVEPEKKYYVYAWYIKESNEIFYIGKGSGKRHLTRKRENKFFMNVLNSHDCDSIILKNNLTEKEAFQLEIVLIDYYRKRSRLFTNIADGGENPPKMCGKRPTEWKENIRKGLMEAYKKHPEYSKASSERMKNFLKTDAGKAFLKKSLESRSTREFKEILSIKCRAANNTLEYRKRHSELMKKVYSSEELRDRERGKNNPRSQGVYQLDVDGTFIKEYDTITQASKETGIGIARISDVARGNRKTAGGFVWKFSNDKHIRHKKKPVYHVENDKSLKPILQYDMNGNFVREYIGIADAARINGFPNRTNIICNLKGRTKSAYGFVWKYK